MICNVKKIAFVFASLGIGLQSTNSLALDEQLTEMALTYRDLTLKAAERKNCYRFSDAGKKLGRRDYLRLFPTCTNFLLQGGSYTSFFHQMPTFEDQNERCYEAGYREGFVRENVKQWIPCMKEISAVLADANEEITAKCRALGEENNLAIGSIPMRELTIKANEDDFLSSEAYARVVFFANNGFGNDVWSDLLRLAGQRQVDVFSCNLAFATGLLGEDKK